MKVTVIFQSDAEEDGISDTVMYTRDDVEFIQDLLDVYAVAARAASFTYVDRIGYATEKGETIWSKF